MGIKKIWDGTQWRKNGQASNGVVLYDESQTLSDSQKTQARSNIGAQGITDNNLTTGSKQIVGAINELDEEVAGKANASDVYSKTEVDTSLLSKQDKSDSSVYIASHSIVGAINNNHEEISNLKAIGRFLAVWNCTTGLPTTEPTTSPYTYKTGDYFLVGTVGDTNYKPNGSTYTIGVASTTVESGEVTVSDYYVYDGTSWILLKNTQKALTFANITGQPSDNTALNTVLANKVGKTDWAKAGIGGVLTSYPDYGFAVNNSGTPYSPAKTYAQYQSAAGVTIIGKDTLENVLTGKNINNVVNESWSFVLSDGTTVVKSVKVGS